MRALKTTFVSRQSHVSLYQILIPVQDRPKAKIAPGGLADVHQRATATAAAVTCRKSTVICAEQERMQRGDESGKTCHLEQSGGLPFASSASSALGSGSAIGVHSGSRISRGTFPVIAISTICSLTTTDRVLAEAADA